MSREILATCQGVDTTDWKAMWITMTTYTATTYTRVVVKLGTGLLTGADNRLDRERVAALVASLATIGGTGVPACELILVSSGAIAAGMGEMGFEKRPKTLPELQACAAVGQTRLMSLYESLFAQRNRHIAQILLTHEDLRDRDRHLNARNTLLTLLGRGVVPIINENDTVAVEEIKFGDNDRLAALVATLVGADLLVILTSVDGLLDQDGKVVSRVEKIDAKITKLARGAGSETSIGGMISKLEAAKIATRAGIPTVIANGTKANSLARVFAGEEERTFFAAESSRMESRKRWIAFFHKPAGALVVDDGAKAALQDGGKSLLAKGVKKTIGQYKKGDVVSIRDENGVEFARGLAKVGGDGLKGATVIVHRDDLVIL